MLAVWVDDSFGDVLTEALWELLADSVGDCEFEGIIDILEVEQDEPDSEVDPIVVIDWDGDLEADIVTETLAETVLDPDSDVDFHVLTDALVDLLEKLVWEELIEDDGDCDKESEELAETEFESVCDTETDIVDNDVLVDT